MQRRLGMHYLRGFYEFHGWVNWVVYHNSIIGYSSPVIVWGIYIYIYIYMYVHTFSQFLRTQTK